MLYKALILPVLLYGAEAWPLLSTDAAALKVFEKKVNVRTSTHYLKTRANNYSASNVPSISSILVCFSIKFRSTKEVTSLAPLA